jgi:hypothetical protein
LSIVFTAEEVRLKWQKVAKRRFFVFMMGLQNSVGYGPAQQQCFFPKFAVCLTVAPY